MSKLGIVLIVILTTTSIFAKQNTVNLKLVHSQLSSYESQLRKNAEEMRELAKTTIPNTFNQNQRTIFIAKLHELNETADASVNLANQIAIRGRKALNRTLSKADMESLGIVAKPLSLKIKLKIAQIPKQKLATAKPLNSRIKIVESNEETVRNERQEYTTMFENFDQKANQLFKILSSVMKYMNVTRTSITRNLL